MGISLTAKRTVAGLTMAGLGLMSVLLPTSSAFAAETPQKTQTVENVGGGTWNYGTGSGCGILKCAWSHYQHNTNHHSATSICGSSNVKVQGAAERRHLGERRHLLRRGAEHRRLLEQRLIQTTGPSRKRK
ncbi:lactococcin 972 family bacteriocin [Dactylosporangium sp. CA-233914]|uniref:lactococcin 972 family bacteriocin n=1 Tax=Dactylosporangium sp. CA-233914 TaxID=3239934 RepID=UPI003D9033B2